MNNINVNTVDIMKNSCFIPYLKTVYKTNTILDFTENITNFETHLDSMRVMNKKFIQLFNNKNDTESLLDILGQFSVDCESYLKMNHTDNKNREIITISNFVAFFKQLKKSISNSEKQLINDKLLDKNQKSVEELYKSELYTESFKEYDDMDIQSFNSMMQNRNETESSNPTHSAMSRISKEIISIKKSLPINFGSSIFYRICTKNLKLHEFIITGPEGTPYDSGCFHFKIYCPNNYPNTSPVVRTCTTGNGSIKFNPNLYKDGTICLSLLGTIQGHQTERWMPTESSMLQIMISIQSLVMNSTPYFNELGYEYNRDSSHKESITYNKKIRYECMKWAMIDMIRNPIKGFEKAILKHFTIKAEYIKMVCKQWVSESDNVNFNKQMYNTLCAELDKLTSKNKSTGANTKPSKKVQAKKVTTKKVTAKKVTAKKVTAKKVPVKKITK